MANTKQIVARTISLLDPRRVAIVTDKAHVMYDERVEGEVNPYTLAKVRLGEAYLPPITVITPENAAELGYQIDPAQYDALVWMGRQRRALAIAADLPLIEAFFEVAKSVEDYNLKSVEENTHRLEMTYQQRVDKAKRFHAAGITDLDKLAACFCHPVSTVETWLATARMAAQVPAVAAALEAGELNTGIANQLKSEPVEVVEKVMEDVAKLQLAALAKAAETGKTEGRVSTPEGNATLETNDKGETAVIPSQDSIQKIKAKAKGKKAPESTKTEGERKAEGKAVIDPAMVGVIRSTFSRMRKLPGHADLVTGAEMALARLMNEAYALPDDASDAAKAAHAIVFPAK